MNFASDNTAGMAPEILDALVRANEGFVLGYGNDDLTRQVERRIAELFEHDVAVFLVPTGTAANALALATLIMDAKLPVRLRLLVPTVENAISGGAMRPGDVFTSRKGITVEIGNTDAEGRLILADALALASEDKPDLLVDFATLTGAARVALGPELPAVFTALADICAGYSCQTRGFQHVGEFAALLTASAALYLAGMVFNDVFDRRRDAIGRPGRPIPSGRIRVSSAAIVGAVLVAIGLGSAMSVSTQALWIALGLTACIIAYDGVLKVTPLGPLAMGGCRFLNVMLGASGDGAAQRYAAMPVEDVWGFAALLPDT